jgi:nitrite reductase/ring-hydroxylating ferredoxin subunit
MAGEDQERLEDVLAVERYIEELQAGRVAHVPAELTPDLARIYRMAMSFHAASTGAAAPRPEFIAELQAKLKQVEAIHRAPLKQHRPCSSKERQEHPRISRRARLRTGAVVAASFSVGASIDHALEEQKRAAITSAIPNPPPWLPLVPAGIPTTKHFVATLDKLGEQPAPFSAGGIVGYVVRNDGESGDPTDGPVIAMSAACTHMGCLVNWENSARTFRCPCHGGVFSAFGKTDTTPSTVRYLAPLPRVETIIDPEGNIFVRVPSQTASIHF